VFGCQWGKYDAFKALKVNPEVHESKRRKGTSSSKCNCPLRIVAIEDPVTLKWKAFIKEEHHNHDPSSESTSHSSHVLPLNFVGIAEANGGYTPPKKYVESLGA